ncbi:copper chaperone PCu(A)C [Stenotrophomonas sp. NA06056]|uniref:copper chaperone PCu(A)C n=1 Tax=Stenotrophomonas sp. NA06056 TaxID=2742129 RepID=UPI00158BBF9F|nr:copper chaperone PCu(A)C [Stenotrophomonas sp. NA06056]QKW58964.1 copper chaperone PCu(A)C [Stenotrophomonas sp. NA06056]
MITKPFVGVLLMMCAGAASAAGTVPNCVTVSWPWVRLPPNAEAMPMTAGYAVIRNGCDTKVVITGARTSFFDDVSFHETRIVDGVSRMRPVERLPLAPGASAELRPGGLHLMLSKGTRVLHEGQPMWLQLQLEGGTEVSTALIARKAAP